MNEEKVERYAFIDVQNTVSTVSQMLYFEIDWNKTYLYLKKHWGCTKIFFYAGVREGDVAQIKKCEELLNIGFEMKIKPYSVYKNPEVVINVVCPDCNHEIKHKVGNSTRWKSNCDVEFSVDVENNIKVGTDLLFFTGDGDFEYLIRDVVEKGVKVYIISSAKKIYTGPRYFISRFSTKLRNLINEKRGRVNFVDIDLWKNRIKK